MSCLKFSLQRWVLLFIIHFGLTEGPGHVIAEGVLEFLVLQDPERIEGRHLRTHADDLDVINLAAPFPASP